MIDEVSILQVWSVSSSRAALEFQQFLKCQATRGRAHNKDYSAQEDIQVALVLNGGFFIGPSMASEPYGGACELLRTSTPAAGLLAKLQ